MESLDIGSLGLLPPLPAAFLRGESLDLLEPLRFLQSGDVPGGGPPLVDRSAVAAALAAANEAYGHPAAASLASKLADPATRVVVTGQQAGMFGGPLYTLSKAVAAARWAARLEEEGKPAVALFWVATEDHDFAEVARTTVPGRHGLEHWDLGEDTQPLVPVGERALGTGVAAVFDSWRSGQTSEDYRRWIERVSGWYRSDVRFGEAFCRLMVGMMGERCPLLVDAMLPELKRAQQAGLVRLVEERVAVEEALAGADGRIEESGFDLQVKPRRGSSPLFLIHEGQRRRIEWRGSERFGLRGLEDFERDIDTLRSIIEENPAAVSPGVLVRPVFQDLALGTNLQILGPGELAYMAQVAPIYRLLDVEAPWVSLRPQILVFGARQWQHLEELELTLEKLVTGRVEVAAVVADRMGEDFVDPVRRRVEAEVGTLREPILALDPSLEKPFEKTMAQFERGFKMLSAKVAAASARRHEVMARRIQRLVDWVRPGGKMQERAISSAHFVGRFDGFAETLWRQLGLEPHRLHVIDPDRDRDE